ncbi:MAG TPA: hypothetical protein VFC39_08195 [Acidobacteriaceae bacterium]|nr:hypothetical protein [Acidobacteriaceae bacterium]
MSTELNTKFTDDPLGFMKKYSVSPPDAIAHDLGRLRTTMANTTGNDFDLTRMPTARKVAYLNFEKTPRGAVAAMGGAKGASSITVDGTYSVRANAIQSYFLPWNAGSGIIKLGIPALGTSPATDHVRYFFTASVNGCSIFIKGTPQAPQIYHAGGQTGHGNDPLAATNFWRDLMTRYTVAPIAGEVNKIDYISDPTTTSGFTPHVDAFRTWVTGNAANDFTIERIDPWGCVMGLRDLAGNWGFYLQENATIVHCKFSKAHWYSLKKSVKGTSYASARPMLFRKFFPGGLAHVNFVPTMPRRL